MAAVLADNSVRYATAPQRQLHNYICANFSRHLWGLWPPRNHQSLDPATNEPNTVGPPTTQPAANSCGATPPDNYAKARKIPYLKETVYVYPDAGCDISRDHRTRFPIVKDILQKNVENNSKLRNYTRDLSYEMRMCGVSCEDSKPSILVFCPIIILKRLKSILTKPHVKEQYHLDSATGPSASYVSRYRIFFWGEPREPLWGRSAIVNIDVDGKPGSSSIAKPSGLTMCGTLVTAGEAGERHSTIGCVLRVGSQFYGLTSAHTFEDLRPSSAAMQEDPDDEDSDAEDGEYDLDLETLDKYNGQQLQLPLEQPNSKPGPIHYPSGTSKLPEVLRTYETSNRLTIRSPPAGDDVWNSNHPDRDWALIHLTGRIHWRPNACFSPSQPQKPIFCSKVASHCPSEKRNVYIVSSRSVSQHGTLHTIPSYIGGYGTRACEVWTVSVSDNDRKPMSLLHIRATANILAEELKKGDSGSIVVDARTQEVYGHVVAVNPLRDLYVVPLKDTLEQIEEVFDTIDVSLPDNLGLLLDLLALYSARSQFQEINNISKAIQAMQRDRVAVSLEQSLKRYLQSKS